MRLRRFSMTDDRGTHRMPRLAKSAFESLVQEHHAAVFRSAQRLAGSPAEAADIVQDVFVRVLEGKARLDAAADARAALCWLATKLACNAVRSRCRRHHHEEQAMTAKTSETDARNDPANACAERDLHRTVQQLVQEMPGELRVPLQLRCQDDLTFAAIGTALRIPESTAHERVQRALQRLRTALAGRGFAVAAAGVPELVAQGTTPATPTGLEARLLALGDGALLAPVGLFRKLALGVVAATGAVVLVAVAGPFGTDEATPAMVAAHPAAREIAEAPSGPPVLPDPGSSTLRVPAADAPLVQQDPAPAATSVFTGSVRDAGAWPVAGARIVAVTAGGLKPFAVGETKTDGQGAFRLELTTPTQPVPSRVVRLQVIEDERTLLETAELSLPRDPAAPSLVLTLPEALGTAMSRFELAVAVRGPDGEPLANVPVVLYGAASPRPRPLQTGAEVEGTTGADGVARLGGRTLGDKWLFVDGRAQACGTEFTNVRLDKPGSHRHETRLMPGRNLAGRVTTVDGSVPEWANVWLEDEASRVWHSTTMAADGSVAFAGLGAGTYALHVHTQHWSPAMRTGLRASAEPFTVTLKRSDDERDVGDHLAELHGRLVDAATGATIPFTAHAIDVLPRRPGESTLPLDVAEPPRPVQTMVDHVQREQFHCTGLAAGTWMLVARVQGYAVAVQEFTLRPAEMRTALAIPLERGAVLQGRVVDADGRPVPRGNVFVVGAGELADRVLAGWQARATEGSQPGPAPSMLASSSVLRDEGRFVLSGVPPGVAVRVVASVKGRPLCVLPPRVLRPGETVQDLELRVPAR
jgi:RNA polymerase sigma-70 factor (ECF subfamily)